MKKLLLTMLFLACVCDASQAKQSEKLINNNEEILQLKKKVEELDKKIDVIMKKIDQLHKKSLSIEPIVVVEAEQPLDLINIIEEQSVKKPKISWGKRAHQKDKVVEKKEVNKEDDKEESIADADDNQGGD